MHTALTFAVVGAALVAAVASGVLAVTGRHMFRLFLLYFLALELLLLVQAGYAVVQLFGTQWQVDAPAFTAWITVSLLIAPLALLWARTQRTRGGLYLLAFACLLLAATELWLQYLWTYSSTGPFRDL